MPDYRDRLLRTAQGEAKPQTPEDQARDKVGFTHPNLHRVTDPKQKDNPYEVEPRKYRISVQGTDGYLTTEIITHTEEMNPEFQEKDENGNIIGEREIP